MDNKIILKYIGYARKSSDDNKERQAASLPEQIYALEGIKAKHNLIVIDTSEESQSAHKIGRNKFNLMLERIDKGEANAILTWHLNRLARNMVDGGRIIQLMDEDKLIEIRTPSRIYKNSPDDKFMLVLEFGMSKKDSDDKSIVVGRGLEKKARDGWRPGVAPQGYLNDKNTESGFRKIFTDKDRFSFIKQIFEMFYGGTPVIEIHRIAKDEWHFLTRQKKRIGGKPLSISIIYAILTNPFYCGRYEYPVGSGKWYDGSYGKAVSAEMFDAIQAKLGRRSPYKLKTHEFAFSGLMQCGICGSGVVAEEKWQCICKVCKLKFSLTKNNREKCTGCGTLIKNMENPTILHYIYYRCGKKKNRLCLEKGIRLDGIEGQIIGKLGLLAIPDCFMDWAVEQIEKMGEQEKELEKDKEDSSQRAYDECKKKLQNLLQLKISSVNSDGSLLSDEEYKVQKTELEKELKTLEGQGINKDKVAEANEKTAKAVTFAILAQRRFTKGDPAVKRDIFMGLGLHPTLEEKIVRFNSPKYLFALEKIKKDIDNGVDGVAPLKKIDSTGQMGDYFNSIPTVLRGRELRPTCEIMSLTCTVHYPARSHIIAFDHAGFNC